ncbi:glycoside hydrolase superfamily [Lipomyces tetrasporus]|uniref:Glycoside hydrolase superfamily n=1 Tax=Lipomyces tetrasporus TaxID=54092 RepID=A0AAD7QRD1_9ASCO|nr:glycoside hydrolase superfamily [Lipomyces tetrasporus]KAJ8098372.1 glycoside hydrolase superfamily [Lipomyces tetrasporus]
MVKSAAVVLLALVALLQGVLAQPVNVQKRHAHNLHRRSPSPVAEAEPDVVYVTVAATVTAQAYQNDDGVVVVTAVVDQWGNPIVESSTTTSIEPTTTSVAYVAPAVAVADVSSSSSAAPTTSSTVAYVAPAVLVADVTSSSSVAPPTSSTVAYVAPTTSSTSEYVAPTTSSTSTTAPESSPASTSSSAPAASSSSSSGSFSGAKGIVYSPYNADGTCKSASDVASDVSNFGSYELIRLYGVDCAQVENVWAAISSSQKLFLGIYDVSALDSAVSAIASTAGTYSWDQVHTVAIGNELVNSGQKSADEVVSLVNTGRSLLRAAGFNGPVVTVDTFVAVIANPSLCAASDYAAVNCHPFFDGNVVAQDSGSFVQTQIGRVSDVCPGQDVLITESGWPKQGQNNNVAVPSVENQKAAVTSLVEYIADQLIEFTAFNDYWKPDGLFGVEKYWGILDS